MLDLSLSCTSVFKKQLDHLQKKHHQYGSICADIYAFLSNQNKSTIFEQQEFIDNKPPHYRVIKLRLGISCFNKSEREGFRLYYNVLNKDDKTSVCLLYIYPKTGSYGINNINKQFIKDQTALFASEKKDNKLIGVSLDSENRTILFNTSH